MSRLRLPPPLSVVCGIKRNQQKLVHAHSFWQRTLQIRQITNPRTCYPIPVASTAADVLERS